MAAVAYKVGLTPQSEQVIDQHAQRPTKIRKALASGIDAILADAENTAKLEHFEPYSTGGGPAAAGKLKMRSRQLRNVITSEHEGVFDGWFGVPSGAGVDKYAWLMTDQERTVRPVNANHLWIPIADNLTASGVQRMSPSEAHEKRGPRGGKLLSIFTSKKGNLVATLRTGGTYKRGDRKGQVKAKLLFVLEDEVRVEGADVLGQVVDGRGVHWRDLLNRRLHEALNDGGPT